MQRETQPPFQQKVPGARAWLVGEWPGIRVGRTGSRGLGKPGRWRGRQLPLWVFEVAAMHRGRVVGMSYRDHVGDRVRDGFQEPS